MNLVIMLEQYDFKIESIECDFRMTCIILKMHIVSYIIIYNYVYISTMHYNIYIIHYYIYIKI